MNPSLMHYAYSTKNFHRYEAGNPDGSIREVYIPRGHMAQPVSGITISPSVTNAQVVAEKSKPARA